MSITPTQKLYIRPDIRVTFSNKSTPPPAGKLRRTNFYEFLKPLSKYSYYYNIILNKKQQELKGNNEAGGPPRGEKSHSFSTKCASFFLRVLKISKKFHSYLTRTYEKTAQNFCPKFVKNAQVFG
jgi:hypothetical protein